MIKKFFILFILIFLFSSSCCFASATLDNVDVELFDNIINHFVDNSSNFDLNSSLINELNANDFYTYFLTKKEEFKEYLDSINATNKNLIIFITSQTEEIEIAFVPTNNTVGDLEYIEAYKTSSSQITVLSQYKTLILEFHPNWSKNQLQSKIDFLASIKYGGTTETPNFRFNTSSIIINNENMTIDCACFYGLNAEPLNILNYKTSSIVTDDFYYTLTDFTDTTTEVIYPDNPPSGDNGSGDTGGGTTNPSGDTGTTTPDYNEKLDNIQSGINDIKNKIPTSGDITQAGVNANKDYWGASGDLTGKEQEEIIEQGINDVIDTVSGDFAKNEIFQMLDHYNNEMWGIFTGESDFKIEWSDVKYQDIKLISAGSINFTQICKDIEILGYIKSLINIIISFHVILALVEQIYNLILSTLGIDNPYLYEDGNYTEITNVQTGERTEKLYRNRRVYKK